MPGQPQPIESYFEGDRFGPVQMGKVEFAGRDAFDQLVRESAKQHVLLRCGHVVSQVQAIETKDKKIRGIAGVCYYCALEVQEEQNQRIRAGAPLMSSREVWLRCLVCTGCAREPVEGTLCCKRHAKHIETVNGVEIYWGQEELEVRKKEEEIAKILGLAAALFSEDGDLPEKPNSQEPSNPK